MSVQPQFWKTQTQFWILDSIPIWKSHCKFGADKTGNFGHELPEKNAIYFPEKGAGRGGGAGRFKGCSEFLQKIIHFGGQRPPLIGQISTSFFKTEYWSSMNIVISISVRKLWQGAPLHFYYKIYRLKKKKRTIFHQDISHWFSYSGRDTERLKIAACSTFSEKEFDKQKLWTVWKSELWKKFWKKKKNMLIK